MKLEVGLKAPNFTLKTKTADGIRNVTLSDNYSKRQTVLLFVPLAFTPVCTKELCIVTEDYESFSNLDATVYGISTDSPFALDAWAKASKMGITLLSDMKREIISQYEILDTELFGLGGVAKRSAFVINKDGVITYIWIAKDPGEFPDFDGIKLALKTHASINS